MEDCNAMHKCWTLGGSLLFIDRKPFKIVFTVTSLFIYKNPSQLRNAWLSESIFHL